tara:strand:- start:1121 stop:1342 length:222 start_codon:yes stop_codon:yes gene_type:complete
MKYKAYFIGGAFDLTKAIVSKRDRVVDFFEPLNEMSPYITDKDTLNEPRVCNVLHYILSYETRDGALVYELER